MEKDPKDKTWKQRLDKRIEDWYSYYNTSIANNVILLTILGVIVFLAFSSNLEDNATLIVLLITAIISFMLMLEQHRVAETQEKSNTEQRKSNIEQRYNYAISQIESKREGVVRIGFQNLYELALEEQSNDKRKRICTVFCNYLQTESGVQNSNISPATVRFILDLLIEKKNGKEIPFSNEWLDLSNVNFQRANLNNANLKGAQLQGANLWNTELQGANLEKAQFQGADLREAQLQGADLIESNLQGVYLTDAHLQEANLKGVKLDNVKLQGANFTGAKNLTATQLQRAKDSNLERVHLSGIDLNNGDFSNFNLSNAQLQGVNLERVQFQGANLQGTQFQGANLWNTELQGANLSNAQFQGANLSEAQLQGAYLWNTKLQGANLQGVQLQEADLRKAQLQGASLEKAQLQRADLKEAEFQGAYLSKAQFQGAEFKDTDFSGTYTDYDNSISGLTDLKRAVARLTARSGEPTDLKNTVFGGGVGKNDLPDFKKKRKVFEKVLTDINYNDINNFKNKMDKVENILSTNSGHPNTSMPSQGVITGEYDKDEAQAVIDKLNALKKTN